MSQSKLDRILGEITEDERAALEQVLHSDADHRAVTVVLNRHGYDLGESSVRRWRDRNLG